MLPPDHASVIVCGTRRAEQWRRAFANAGITAIVVETDGEDSEKGACAVGVPKARRIEANAIITAVTRGEQQLPGAALGIRGIVAIAVIAALIAAVAVGNVL
jgi:hypothetical protein